MRACSEPGSTCEADAPQDLPVVDGDVQVVDLERRGNALGDGSFGGSHVGHCNNTTAVVEIRFPTISGVTACCLSPFRRRLRSPAPWPGPRTASRPGPGSRRATSCGPRRSRPRGRRRRRGESPVTPSSTSSGAAPQFVVTTGVPHAMASTITRPNGSGQRIGKIMAQARPSMSTFFSCETFSYSSMSLASSGSISCSKYSRSGCSLRFSSICSGRPARRAMLIASFGPLSGFDAPDVHEHVVLLLAEGIRARGRCRCARCRCTADVGVVGPLRVADRDEVHVPTGDAVEAAASAAVHGPCSVCTTGGRPVQHAHRRSGRRSRRGRGRRRTRPPAGTPTARGSRRTRRCRARAGRAAPPSAR